MSAIKNGFLLSLAAALFVSLGACGKAEENSKGQAEKAGAAIGQAVDQAKEQAGQAMEKAGDAMKEAGDKAKEVVKDAMKEGKK